MPVCLRQACLPQAGLISLLEFFTDKTLRNQSSKKNGGQKLNPGHMKTI